LGCLSTDYTNIIINLRSCNKRKRCEVVNVIMKIFIAVDRR